MRTRRQCGEEDQSHQLPSPIPPQAGRLHWGRSFCLPPQGHRAGVLGDRMCVSGMDIPPPPASHAEVKAQGGLQMYVIKHNATQRYAKASEAKALKRTRHVRGEKQPIQGSSWTAAPFQGPRRTGAPAAQVPAEWARFQPSELPRGRESWSVSVSPEGKGIPLQGRDRAPSDDLRAWAGRGGGRQSLRELGPQS